MSTFVLRLKAPRPTFALDMTDEERAVMGRHAALTSRHYVDCSNRVDIGEFTTVAGARSQILTHAIDFTRMNSGDPLDVALSSFLAVREATIK